MSDAPQEENLEPLAFDTFVLAFYRKGTKHATEESPELEARHQAHLRHLKQLNESGKIIASGPLSDTPDDTWRGVCLFNTTLEEAAACMAADPQVQAGHFSYQVMRWHMPKGRLKYE